MMTGGEWSDSDQSWQDRSACIGTDPAIWYPEKSRTGRQARGICATCPVLPQCLEAALERREPFGLWAGTNQRQRRRLYMIWLKRSHPYDPHCRKRHCWCAEVRRHQRALDGKTVGPMQINGVGARCGKASTYARGHRDGACTLAFSPLGRRMRDAGIDILDWWHEWVGPDLERGENGSRYNRAKVLAGLRLSLGDAGEELHDLGLDLADWFARWFGDQQPEQVATLALRMAEYELTEGVAA